MAEIVGRKLVENGQERILHRIFDGLTSNFVLDVADSKQSQEHQLIHLVWRRFPRNRTAVEGPKTTCPISTQTEISNISDMDSATDIRGLFGGNESVLISDDAGSTSDCSTSFSDYKFPAKGRTSKPKNFEQKSQTKLDNRFKYFEEIIPENGTLGETGRKLEEVNSPVISNVNSDLIDRKSLTVSHRNQPSSPPKTEPKLKMPETPKTSLTKSREFSLTSEIPTTSTQEDNSSSLRRRGIVKWFDPNWMRYGFITMNNKDVFFHVDNVHIGKDYSLKQGDEVSFILDEYDKGVIDVQLFPTLSVFTSASEAVARVGSHQISSVPSVPSHVDTVNHSPTRGTVKSYDWFRGCGCIALDGSCVVVPFQDDFGFGFKPGGRALFELVEDNLGKQQAIQVYPFHDALSTRRLSETDSDY